MLKFSSSKKLSPWTCGHTNRWCWGLSSGSLPVNLALFTGISTTTTMQVWSSLTWLLRKSESIICNTLNRPPSLKPISKFSGKKLRIRQYMRLPFLSKKAGIHLFMQKFRHYHPLLRKYYARKARWGHRQQIKSIFFELPFIRNLQIRRQFLRKFSSIFRRRHKPLNHDPQQRQSRKRHNLQITPKQQVFGARINRVIMIVCSSYNP